MKQVLVLGADKKILNMIEQALLDQFVVLSLPVERHLKESLLKNPSNLILLIVTTSSTDGFLTYEIIRTIPELQAVPVIFLAEQSNQQLENRILTLGADDFITLPISPEMLNLRVSNCMELSTLRNEHGYAEKYQDAIAFSFAELVECRDETTGGHLKNTTLYFNIILEAVRLSGRYNDTIQEDDIKDLLRSVTLHDIGKIGINDEILHKSSPLDYREYESMKTHTTLGMETFDKIIQETGGTRWMYLAKDIAYCHHERWDGTGYPNGLMGNEIPIYARILALADVYDALTSKRSYKESYTHQKAMDIIVDGKGSFFDPDLVDIFVAASKQFEKVLQEKASI
ncbi:MAG: HD domain-containing phosphohydrolase [Mobilitalea sp.]